MAHHQEADRVDAQLAGRGDVARGDVGFSAVGADPDDADTRLACVLQISQAADTGQHQRGDVGTRTAPATASIHSTSVWAPNP